VLEDESDLDAANGEGVAAKRAHRGAAGGDGTPTTASDCEGFAMQTKTRNERLFRAGAAQTGSRRWRCGAMSPNPPWIEAAVASFLSEDSAERLEAGLCAAHGPGSAARSTVWTRISPSSAKQSPCSFPLLADDHAASCPTTRKLPRASQGPGAIRGVRGRHSGRRLARGDRFIKEGVARHPGRAVAAEADLSVGGHTTTNFRLSLAG